MVSNDDLDTLPDEVIEYLGELLPDVIDDLE